LAIEIHKVSLSLPKFELYEEGSQLRRSAKAIPVDIVEGFGRRRYKNEFIRFLTFALASCDETKEHLKILYETEALNDNDIFNSLIRRYEDLGRKIHNFIKAVESGGLQIIVLYLAVILHLETRQLNRHEHFNSE
jgi:four helix bundle protein